MNSHFPCITIGFNHFWFTSNAIITLFYIGTIYAHLPVPPILDSIRGIKIDALHLPLHPLTIQQGVHHQQTVTLDESVLPVVAMLIVACQTF